VREEGSVALDSDLTGCVAQAGLDAALAGRRGSCPWDVDHAGWIVTLQSPDEQDFSGKTLEEALAWCLVWLMAKGTLGDWGHELGVGPFLS
jgi:hypothetical protein